ncbi:MAG: hypothetical protein IT258_05570 [Saprospiraceae bacterium]|nr:hypothetical protein [Saprospiraceae bacterium]
MRRNKTLKLLAMICLPAWVFGQTPGQPDTGFGQMGEVTIPVPGIFSYTGGTLLLPDGKMIVSWQKDENGGTTLGLTRLLPDGSIDNSFGTQGTAFPSLDIGEEGYFDEMTLTADNKIIGVGRIVKDTVYQAFIARFNEDGELDASFGDNGLTTIDEGDLDDELETLYIVPDGKILAGGLTLDSANPGFYDLLLVQLLPDGQLDPAFGNGGIVTNDFAVGVEGILSIAVQSDGKIVASGGTLVDDYNMLMVRYNPDGSLDTSFADNGAWQYGFANENEIAYDVAMVGDKIIFCGISFSLTASNITLFQLNSDGSFDDNFGSGGKVFKEVGVSEFGRKLAIQNDGKILVSGEAFSSASLAEGYLYVCRFLPDGTTDETFGDVAGIAQPHSYAGNVEGIGLFLQPDGKIVATAFGTEQVIIWRFLNDDLVGTSEAENPNFDFTASPNPTQGYLQIEWTLDKRATVYCELVDAQGRTLQSLVNKSDFMAGTHQFAFNINPELASNIAFLKLDINGRISTKPIAILK